MWYVLAYRSGTTKWLQLGAFTNESDMDIEREYWTRRYPEYNICISDTPASEMPPLPEPRDYSEVMNSIRRLLCEEG